MLIIAIILEILSTCLIIYGFIHKEKVLALEDDIKRKIRKAKRLYKAVKVGVCKKVLEKEGIKYE